MTNSRRTILRGDQVRRYTNTTAYWTEHANAVPGDGDVIIYRDGGTITVGGATVHIPRIKIGDGVTALGELPFTDRYVEYLAGQIADSLAAVATSGDYDDLSNKLVGGRGIEIKPLVPDEYTMINWAANESSTYINTGIVPDVDDIEMELIVKPTVGSWYIWQSRPSGGTTTGISGSSTNNIITFNYCGTTLTSTIQRYDNDDYQYLVRAKAKDGVATLYVKRLDTDMEDTQTDTYTYTPQTLPLYLFGNQNGNRVARGNHIYSAKMMKNGKLVMDYRPVMQADNNVGFFDVCSYSYKSPNRGSLYKSSDNCIIETPIAIHCAVNANN